MKRFRRIISAIICSSLVCGCASNVRNYSKKDPARLYSTAMQKKDSHPNTALEDIAEIETYYPTSSEAEKALLLKIYILYQEGRFDESIEAKDDFQIRYPTSKYIAYSYYMSGINYYTQIVDIGREQYITYKAKEALEFVAQNFPDTDYGRDAARKARYCAHILAAKEMDIGRFYEKKGDYLAASNRYKKILEGQYDSALTQEATYRMAVSWYGMGMKHIANLYYLSAKKDYPDSIWTKRIHQVLFR
ncbi:Outer membrane protein assembly factor BamD precursor [Candidatus Fokinia solitaria]|uniref:Outer membrane protein assembly factor BamD n=1 Tax=Candidatus Fokinia solitaria TaxID=1802984 RepID=A0A2U8BSU1_9RICK|nr:outer membrane protein assembly factor BamD [Candidatus Fokinia solitaria]AWD33424.1 Outer membrane protein assembly factor BamD precursor [Candidatus Fokinia solitaria]